MSRRTTRAGLGAAVLLSGLWMWTVPDYVHRYEISAASAYAENVALSCRDARAADGVECERLGAAAFDTALDPVVKEWRVGGPFAYAGAMLILLWATVGGIALTID